MKRKRIVLMLGALVLTATMIDYTVAQEGRPRQDDRKYERERPHPHDAREAEDRRRREHDREHDRKHDRKHAEHMEVMIRLVQRMKHICFDSETVGVMAIGALKDDIRRKDEAIIKDLEEQLAKVKTQGLRNALRLSLKDIYKRQGKNEKVIAHIKALIAENDKALQSKASK